MHLSEKTELFYFFSDKIFADSSWTPFVVRMFYQVFKLLNEKSFSNSKLNANVLRSIKFLLLQILYIHIENIETNIWDIEMYRNNWNKKVILAFRNNLFHLCISYFFSDPMQFLQFGLKLSTQIQMVISIIGDFFKNLI